MATDVGLSDGAAITAALFNDRIPFIAGANKTKVKILYARIRYNGSAWEVHSGTDSAGIVSGNLAWSTNHVVITLSGYSTVVPAFATPVYNSAVSLIPQVFPSSASALHIYFIDYAGAIVSTQATTMDCTLLALGI